MSESIYKRVLLGIVRHLISKLSGILLAWGLIDASTSDEFTATAAMELVGWLVTFAASIYLSYKNQIFEFVKTRVAIWLPPNSTIERVNEVAAAVPDKLAVAKGEVEMPEIVQTPSAGNAGRKP